MTGICASWQASGKEDLEPKDIFMPPIMSISPSGFRVCLKHIIACTFLI